MKQPRVLVLDIETSPMVAYVWGRRDVNIATNHIKSDWFIIAWAAKWLDKPGIIYYDQRCAKRIENDWEILTPLWKLLDEADIVITQNGKNFDGPKINARFIMHGLKPPSPYRHLDTYQIVRSVAKFTSNGLDYLSEKLCTKYKKLKHEKFPGMSLWTECLARNKDAWKEMERYNKHDVLATEELYTKIRAWAPASAPSVHVPVDPLITCRCCGKDGRLIRYGTDFTKKNGRRQRYQCQNCGSFTMGGKL